MADTAQKTINMHIRVLPEQWERIEQAAQGTALTANQLVIELAIEALDRREWPRTEAQTGPIQEKWRRPTPFALLLPRI